MWLNHAVPRRLVPMSLGIGADSHAANHAAAGLPHRAAYAATGAATGVFE
jgi:hypothetical protein